MAFLNSKDPTSLVYTLHHGHDLPVRAALTSGTCPTFMRRYISRCVKSNISAVLLSEWLLTGKALCMPVTNSSGCMALLYRQRCLVTRNSPIVCMTTERMHRTKSSPGPRSTNRLPTRSWLHSRLQAKSIGGLTRRSLHPPLSDLSTHPFFIACGYAQQTVALA